MEDNNKDKFPEQPQTKAYVGIGAHPITTTHSSGDTKQASGETITPEVDVTPQLSEKELAKLEKKQRKIFEKMIKERKQKAAAKYLRNIIGKRKVNKGRKGGRVTKLFVKTETMKEAWEQGQEKNEEKD